jgi:branched-chain amino acid transport system substrate-binding protein
MRVHARPFLAAATSALLLGACAGPPDRVQFGVSIAKNHQTGAILAVEEINRSGGIRGVPVQLYGLEYSRSQLLDARETLDWAHDFAMQEDLLAVIGPSDSASTLVTGGLYNQLGLLQVATVASNAAITNLGPWTYRICVSDRIQGRELARYATEGWNKQRAVVVFVNDDYGRALGATFSAAFTDAGGRILDAVPTTEVFSGEDRDLVRSVLERHVSEGFGEADDILALFVRERQAARIVDLLIELGGSADVLGGDALAYPQFALASAEHDLDVRLTLFFAPELVGSAATDFVRRFRERFDTEPLYGAAFAYDATHLLARAVAAGGFTRGGARQALERFVAEGEVIHGVAGDFRFNADRDAVRGFAIGRISGGSFAGIRIIDPLRPGPAATD